MYKEYIARFILAGMVLVSSCVCARELKINRIAAKPAFQMEYLSESMTEEKKSFMEMLSAVSSGQRVVDYEILEQTMQYQLSDKDLDALQRIVEAEAGGEDQDGKLLVALEEYQGVTAQEAQRMLDRLLPAHLEWEIQAR